MLLTVTRLSLSHAGLPSQSVGVWGVPPAAGGKRKLVFRGLPRACWEFFFLTNSIEVRRAWSVGPCDLSCFYSDAQVWHTGACVCRWAKADYTARIRGWMSALSKDFINETNVARKRRDAGRRADKHHSEP